MWPSWFDGFTESHLFQNKVLHDLLKFKLAVKLTSLIASRQIKLNSI